MLNLTTMKLDELKDIARGYGIAGAWKMTKAQLIEAILKNAEINGHADKYCADEPETTEEPTIEPETTEAETTEETEAETPEEPEDTTEEEPEEEEEREVTISIRLNVNELTDEIADLLDQIIEDNPIFDEWQELVLKRRAKKASKHINMITWNGQTKSIKEWASELGMQWPALYDRINRNGWTIEEAMTIPVGGRRTKKTEA